MSKDLKEYIISRKIIMLMREGYAQRQATAIALRMWRDGELDIQPKPRQRNRQPYNRIRSRGKDE